MWKKVGVNGGCRGFYGAVSWVQPTRSEDSLCGVHLPLRKEAKRHSALLHANEVSTLLPPERETTIIQVTSPIHSSTLLAVRKWSVHSNRL